jgi:multiple sugar transport system ATP-binding protein
MAQVSVSRLKKSYHKTDVIHGIDFTVVDGEFVALVGPSGCGKSTLLRMIAGLEEVTGGTISIGGKVVNDVSPKQRDIAMVFQNYALYPHMTVARNMGFSLYLRGGSKEQIAERVTGAATMLGLSEYLERFPGQLSGGQRQRVAMGRAIVRQPSVFLFDEPLSNLDAALRVQMRADIRSLHDRLGSTSIFVTHDQVEAMTMSDRIMVLRHGKLEQAGSPLDLYDRPGNVFVAGFIGSPAMNLLPATAADGMVLLAEGVSVPLETSAEGAVTWGIRPEHLDWVPETGEGVLTGTVKGLERTGVADLVIAECAGRRVTALFSDRYPLARGAPVHLRPRPGLSHLFHGRTGERLP